MLLHMKAGCVTMMQMALSLAEEDNGNGPIKVSKATYTHVASPVCAMTLVGRSKGHEERRKSSESVPDHLVSKDKKNGAYSAQSPRIPDLPPPLHRKENTAQPLCNRNLRHEHRDTQAP